MNIRIQSTGEVVSEQGFRALHPNTSMPQQLTEELINSFGGDVVFEGPQASGGDHYQYSQAAGVEQVNGKWYTKYVLGPVFTDNEDASAVEQQTTYHTMKDAEQSKSVRATRDSTLATSDWRVIKAMETGVALSTEWATYRQQLRDITEQDGFPWSVQWPTQPE